MSALLVITSPNVVVDRPSVAEWCESGPMGGLHAEPLGVDVQLAFPSSTSGLIEMVSGTARQDPMVIAVTPGEAGFVLDRVPDAGDRRIIWLELEAASTRRVDGRPLIRGRGVNGYHWAVRWAHWRWQVPFITIRYGAHPENVGELRLPRGAGPFPVVVVIHGGYYREQWERDTAEPMAVDLAERGFSSWNIEYRRTGPGGGGGWPGTFEDVGAAIDHLPILADRYPLDLGRVIFAGHSAGGQLALWAASRPYIGSSTGGRPAAVAPVLAVSLAGIADLGLAADRGVGFGHNPITAVMGGMRAEVPSRYAQVSPKELNISSHQLLIQGTGGDDPDLIDMNRLYAASRPNVSYVEVDGADHFDIAYPYSATWERVVSEVEAASVRAQSDAYDFG